MRRVKAEPHAQLNKETNTMMPTPQTRQCHTCWMHTGRFLDMDCSHFSHLMSSNYMTMVHTLKATLPMMTQQRFGHVVVTNSIGGYHGASLILTQPPLHTRNPSEQAFQQPHLI